MIDELTRRGFLHRSAAVGAGALGASPLAGALSAAKGGSKMRFGLVTYLWAKDWKLPTLIKNLETSKVLGVELRTTHKHGVERSLSAKQRKEVKKRFDDSPAVLVGIGSNENFDSPDPARLSRAIQATKDFISLSHDVGGSGVKVKPNSFHRDVDPDKTIEQIGKSLNVVGKFGADLGQQIRLEVHGQCCELPTMKKIMDVATHPNVGVCWNCNSADLRGKGLEHNFNLVKKRFGATAHVRAFEGKYPWQDLINLFVRMDYKGWILLEARARRKDYVKALAEQRELFQKMVANAQEKL